MSRPGAVGARLMEMRRRIADLEAAARPARGVLPFGDPDVDGRFPGGGLPLGCWHEAMGEGLEIETAAAAAAFVAALAGPLARRGTVVWVLRRDDLHAPGLFGLGFPAHRLIQVQARGEAQVLAALEDALGTAGVAAAIGESAAVDLVAGRRLQLACERGGAVGFVIRRRSFGGAASSGRSGSQKSKPEGSAAATRWRIACAPSQPSADEEGQGEGSRNTWSLGPPRWRVGLERCRGGQSGAWIMEKSDGPYPLRVVARLGDRQLETAQPFRLAG